MSNKEILDGLLRVLYHREVNGVDHKGDLGLPVDLGSLAVFLNQTRPFQEQNAILCGSAVEPAVQMGLAWGWIRQEGAYFRLSPSGKAAAGKLKPISP